MAFRSQSSCYFDGEVRCFKHNSFEPLVLATSFPSSTSVWKCRCRRSEAMVIAHLPMGTSIQFDKVQRRQRAARKLLQASAARQSTEINRGESDVFENVLHAHFSRRVVP